MAFDSILDENHFANTQFEKETNEKRKIQVFGKRQVMDTFAAFEVVNNKIQDNIIVFQPSFGTSVSNWNIISSEHPCFFDFMKEVVLTDMEDWIKDDDINDYI